MFDFVHERKRVVQIVLLLLILPFAFWGVNSYRQAAGGADTVATVEGEKISQRDFALGAQLWLQQKEQELHMKLDPAVLDNPQVKASILNDLISTKLLAIKGRAAGLSLTDEEMAQVIAADPQFQHDGKFDRQTYEDALRRRSYTPAMYESLIADDFASGQMTSVFLQNGYASNTAAENMVRLSEQQRVVSVAVISPDAFLGQTKVDDVAVKAYYDRNQPEFGIPERAKVEYVLLSPEALMPLVSISAADAKSYYDEHKNTDYTSVPEQRRAAHILFAPKQATEADMKAAREKAESVLKQLRQSPNKFADLAKADSDDPSSNNKGGDLGFFARGTWSKPFEDAEFGLKAGEISGVVQDENGFHIIKLLEVKPGNVKAFEEVKDSVMRTLKLQQAANKYAELARTFTDTVWEQSDSLKPASELVKLPVQQSGWLNKGQPGPAPWTVKALQAVFSDDVLKNKRNSQAVEVAPNTLVSVRLVEYKPAEVRPLAEVGEAIRQKLMREQAGELAAKQGQAVLAQLQRGEKPNLKWGEVQTVSYAHPVQGMDQELEHRIMQADVNKLPAYVGKESAQGGYLLARVDEVKEATLSDDSKRRWVNTLRGTSGAELLQDYLQDVKKRASISAKAIAPGGKS